MSGVTKEDVIRFHRAVLKRVFNARLVDGAIADVAKTPHALSAYTLFITLAMDMIAQDPDNPAFKVRGGPSLGLSVRVWQQSTPTDLLRSANAERSRGWPCVYATLRSHVCVC
eukprot:scaffold120308_cov13-Tisochrysis_lutea.AAC.1